MQGESEPQRAMPGACHHKRIRGPNGGMHRDDRTCDMFGLQKLGHTEAEALGGALKHLEAPGFKSHAASTVLKKSVTALRRSPEYAEMGTKS